VWVELASGVLAATNEVLRPHRAGQAKEAAVAAVC